MLFVSVERKRGLRPRRTKHAGNFTEYRKRLGQPSAVQDGCCLEATVCRHLQLAGTVGGLRQGKGTAEAIP